MERQKAISNSCSVSHIRLRKTDNILCIALVFMFLASTCSNGWPSKKEVEDSDMKENSIEIEAVRKVIEDAYINGIHGNQDEKSVKSGFHRDFAMLVKENGNIKKVTVDAWLEGARKDKVKNPDRWKVETTCNYELIDVTENAAIAKLQVYKGSKHFSTDYMLLYKFPDGWKIVSKIFKIW